VILSRWGRFGRALQQKKLAFDAEQLGSCPAFFAALGVDYRLLDRGEPVGDLPGTAQGLCHEGCKEPRDGPGRAWFDEGGAQQP
jgi:hypothetical protein